MGNSCAKWHRVRKTPGATLPPARPARKRKLLLGILFSALALIIAAGAVFFVVKLGPSQGIKPADVTPGVTSGAEEPSGKENAPKPVDPNKPLMGVKVALDPGHNGKNGVNSRLVNRQVPDGRGGRKICNTTGTATASGYNEHAFTFDVAQRTKVKLEALGAQVVLTRNNDSGVGPCVDKRGVFGQESGADLMVSIHANGTDNRKVRGFFVILSAPPLNAAQGEPSQKLASSLIEALKAEGFPESTNGSLSRRADLAGLNHSSVPTVMVELGEMKNPQEAAVMESEEGRDRYALALTSGIKNWSIRIK